MPTFIKASQETKDLAETMDLMMNGRKCVEDPKYTTPFCVLGETFEFKIALATSGGKWNGQAWVFESMEAQELAIQKCSKVIREKRA